MMDMTMWVELLPAPLIIKNFVEGDSSCNYENYLLELINVSDFFRHKSPCGFKKPYSESNGECDAIGEGYSLDFKLLASKTALQGRSILSSQISISSSGTIIFSGSKCPQGKMQVTRIYSALRGCSIQNLIEMRKANPKKQGIENDVCNYLKSLEVKKNLLFFFPYEITFDTPHTFEEAIQSSIDWLNNDFGTSLLYRYQYSPQFETFFVYLYDANL